MRDSIDHGRRKFIAVAAAALSGARLSIIGSTLHQIGCAELAEHDEGQLPSLSGATAWLNSPPLSSAGLRGKVVLVDFCTYTCVNWLRTLPYVRAWEAKYREAGLVVIGAHTPEFLFEKDLDNVCWALKDMEVNYPIAVDNDHYVWRAFANNYWPAVYLADANGRIRFHHFGEGAYDETERVIQRLLRESGRETDNQLVGAKPRGLEVAADYDTLRSPESYLGYDKSDAGASPADVVVGVPRVYRIRPDLKLNQWALGGDWTVKGRAALLNKADGQIAYRFHARDVNLIIGPPPGSNAVRFTVKVDGKSPGAAHGNDVDDLGHGTADRQRAYQLVRQQYPIIDRNFEIQFSDSGVEAFAFTFG